MSEDAPDATNTSQPYKYSPLAQKCQAYDYTIRLLHLLPTGDSKTSLRCWLTEKNYDDNWSNPPHHDYHTLSYTWGDPVFPEVLDVLSNSVQFLIMEEKNN